MSEFLNIEGLALERGERPDIVARMLVHNGCDLYVWFGELKDRDGVMVFAGHPFDRREHKISPGYYPLTKESQEEFIKRLERGDNSTEGLTMLDTWQLDPTTEQKFTIEITEEDKSVSVFVNPDDVAKLPPPSRIEDTTVTSTPPVRKFFFADNFFHELVLRTIEAVIRETNNTNWHAVRNGLKNNYQEGESIQYVTGYNEEGDSVKYIHFKALEYVEPYKIKESYFKKTLSEYRKHLKKSKK